MAEFFQPIQTTLGAAKLRSFPCLSTCFCCVAVPYWIAVPICATLKFCSVLAEQRVVGGFAHSKHLHRARTRRQHIHWRKVVPVTPSQQ